MASRESIEIGKRKRRELVAFVRAFNAQYWHGPTHEEIGAAIDVSPTQAYNHVQKLLKTGELVRPPGHRTLRAP